MATETTAEERAPELIIFLKNGDTFLFEVANVISHRGDEINFYYTSKSDGERREARFYKSEIAGWSKG